MTLTVKLDDQDRDRLEFLKAFMNVANQSEAVRKLINDRFNELQANKTLVERRGGHPTPIQGGAGLSKRTSRKAAVAEHISTKVARRRSNK